MKTWMYVLIGLVVLVILYFVFFKKKSDSSEEETNYEVQQMQQQPSQIGYTSSVAQIISSLTGLVDASTGGSGFIKNQPEVNS